MVQHTLGAIFALVRGLAPVRVASVQLEIDFRSEAGSRALFAALPGWRSWKVSPRRDRLLAAEHG